MAIKDRLIQFVLRGKDELSPAAQKATEKVDELSKGAAALGQALDDAKDAQGLGKALEQTGRTVAQAQNNLEQTEQQVLDLREALNKNPDAAGLQQSLKDAEREANRARRQLNALESQLAETEKAARAAGVDTDNLGDEQKRLATEVASTKVALEAHNKALQEAKREQAAAARATAEHASRVETVRGAMSSGARQVLAFAAAYVSLSAVFGLVQKGLGLVRDGIGSMLQTGDQFELLDKRMASLMGSVAEGERATAWIKDFAKNTPLEVADVSEAFALLKSYGLDPMGGALQAVVDKNEQLGGGMERLQGISSALGQAYAKQKLQTEEILQLVERGVPAWTMLEKVTGKNAAQLAQLATKGRLGRDVIAALVEEMGKSAQGAAAENMGTLTGLVSNLSDVWSDFLDRIAKNGALDYAKEQLKQVAETIKQMDDDGRLDKLAKSLSDAFQQGAEKVKEWVAELAEVDFKQLVDDSSAWLSDFGTKLDAAGQRVQMFFAPFRSLFNGVTSGLSLAGAALTKFASMHLSVFETLAAAVPDVMGGEKLRASIGNAKELLDGLTAGFVKQIEQDGKDIEAAWDTTAKSASASAKAQTDAVRSESEQQIMLGQAAADHFIANQQKVKDSAIAAATAGSAAIAGMADAIELIDTARTTQQLEGLRGALLTAFNEGQLSQEQFAQATTLLNGRLEDLGSAAGSAAGLVSDLDEKLGDLAQVQAAISNAKTDVDINNIRAALRKLYNDGAITAGQYNEELKKTSERQKELKAAVDEGGKAQRGKNEADKEAIVTSEQLRRESGKRMEAERQAGDQAMQDRRKGSEEAKRDMSAMEGFFGGVMSRAREPLAAMSAAALDAFNALRGIKAADITIDTSSLEATSDSLGRVARELEQVKAAAAMPMLSTLGRWQLETQRASLETQAAFLGQKASLQGLMERYESGALTVRQFVSAAKSAKAGLGLLDDADLSALESAIRAAESQMKQMEQSTRSTLDGLQDELDQLAGREADIERRRFATRKRDLQTQLAEAQAGGNAESIANASRALGMLRQIEDASAQKRQADEQKQRMEANKPAAAEAAPQPRKIVRLELKDKAVDVAVANDEDETSLLSILEDVAKRSL